MTLRLHHELLDPDVPPPDLDAEGPGRPDVPNDHYVIEEGGSSVKSTIIITSDKPKKRGKQWVKPAAYGLCALFVALTAWNLFRWIGGSAERPAPSPFQLKQALYLGVMKVDAYRRAHGFTPSSIAVLDLPQNAYEYRRVNADQYVLAFRTEDGQRFEYNSRSPKEAIFGPSQSILSMGASK